MTTDTAKRSRPATVVAGGIIVALVALSNVATIAAPVPLPIIVVSLGLAAVAVAALAGIWRRKTWGRWLGAVTLGATILAAAPGVVSAPNQGLAVLAGVTVGIAAIGAVLLAVPASRDDSSRSVGNA